MLLFYVLSRQYQSEPSTLAAKRIPQSTTALWLITHSKPSLSRYWIITLRSLELNFTSNKASTVTNLPVRCDITSTLIHLIHTLFIGAGIWAIHPKLSISLQVHQSQQQLTLRHSWHGITPYQRECCLIFNKNVIFLNIKITTRMFCESLLRVLDI